MKESKITGRLAVLVTALTLLLAACANVVMPTGGDRDKVGPRLDTAQPFMPANGSVNVVGNQITLRFDEYLKPGSYGNEIFISPLQKVPPSIVVKGKKLVITLQDTLRPNTTYILSISKEIKDANEGNPMAEPIIYAFSTGAQIDSLGLHGRVSNPLTGKGVSGMTMMLFEADKINGDSIFDQRPVFACQSDSMGNYAFKFLPAGTYKLYAVKDQDKSYSWNQAKEMVGQLSDAIVELTPTRVDSPLRMVTSIPDNEPPRVKSVKWINNHVMMVEFREPLHPKVWQTGIGIELSDTTGENKKAVLRSAFRNGERSVYFVEPGVPSTTWNTLHLTGLPDTLGMVCDTSVQVGPAGGSFKKQPWLREPMLVLEENKFVLRSEFPLGRAFGDSLITLKDSIGNAVKLKVTARPFQLDVELPEGMKPQLMHQLVIRKGFPLTDSLRTDSALKFMVSYPPDDYFGSLNGEIVPDSTDPNARWIMVILRQKKSLEVVKRTNGEMKFNYPRLEPGKYLIMVFRDDDGNGYWTPGSMIPYRLPEKMVLDPRPLEVKAKWSQDNYKVYTTKAPPGKRVK